MNSYTAAANEYLKDNQPERFVTPSSAVARQTSLYPQPAANVIPAKEEGNKHDSGKCRMELLPPELMTGVAEILAFGADKYADRNWEKGMSWSRVYGALMRHMWAWWNPFTSDLDEETGKSHLWHAGCCLSFLIAYESRKTGTDDRPVA